MSRLKWAGEVIFSSCPRYSPLPCPISPEILIVPGHPARWGGAFQGSVAPAGEVGQKKGDGVTHRFWRQQRAVPPSWSWSESETRRLGRDSILPGQCDLPGKFPIFREDSISICKVPIYDRYSNILEGADNGKLYCRANAAKQAGPSADPAWNLLKLVNSYW